MAVHENASDKDTVHMDGEHAEMAQAHKSLHGAAESGLAATDQYGRPLIQIDKAAERRVRLKIDLMIIPTVALLYLFCFIDRANVGNARLAGLERDLNMTGEYDYNQMLSIFYISYILAEIPSGIACKWMGPGWFIPLITVLFGVASLGTGFVNDLPQACGVRFVLGVFESGMMPGISFYMSRWYRRSELAFRISLFMVMAPLAGAFGGLLASAILTLDSVGSLREWRMIFVVEGIITIGLGLIAFATMTDRPETARWLTQEEKDIAIARIKSERVGQTDVVDKLGGRKALLGVWNPVVLATAFIFLLNNITVQGLAFFLPTIVGDIYPDATTVKKQLYTVPPYIVGAFFTLFLPALSWKTDRRQIWLILSAPLVMVGYIMFLASENNEVRYAATFLLASSCTAVGPLANAQAAVAVLSDTARAMSLATNMMFGNAGGLVSTWSYIAKDAPGYEIGHGLNLAASSSILIFGTGLWFWMKWDNKQREKRDVDQELEGLSREEIEDLEWKHPGWRWSP